MLFSYFLKLLTVITIEAHTKRTENEYQGNPPTDFHEAATETMKVAAHVYEVYSCFCGKKKQKTQTLLKILF